MTKLTPNMDYDKLGSKCFQEGDYLGALEHFNKAIKSSSPKLVPNILNKRSLVYIKLEKFPQALRDGHEIIKRMPDMAMGYLRCGQVVQLMGQRDKALDILERGMNKVAGGDRKIIVLHYTALLKQTQAPIRLDPLAKLPREIVQDIWKLLDIKSRGRCLSVSKGWKKSVESYPPLWQDLTLTDKMSGKALSSWLRRAEHSGHSLRSATVSSNGYNQQYHNRIKLVQRCTKLDRFMLEVPSEGADILAMLPSKSTHLKTLVVSCDSWVPISSVKKIMLYYHHLEHVEFHSITKPRHRISWPEMPNLRHIVLRPFSGGPQCAGGAYLEWNELIRASPNVKSATIRNWRGPEFPGIIDLAGWTNLTFLKISSTLFASIPTFPTTLTHLEADGVLCFTLEQFHNTQRNPFHLPNLHHLDVNDSYFSDIINELANPALISGTLKRLDIGGTNCYVRGGDRGIWPYTLPAPSTALEFLSLRAQTELPEKTIIKMLRKYPNLKHVDLSVTCVTGSTLRELFERENKPDFIDLESCDDCYYDAVEAAREEGIEVVHELAPKKKMYKGKAHPTYD